MKILLVQPAPFEESRLGLENAIWLSEPVALTSIAAMVPDHDVRIVDLRLEPANVLPELLETWRPHIVGTTAMTTDAYQAKSVLYLAKRMCPETLTIIGGHHATMVPEFYDEAYVDIIVKGEGELCFQSIVESHAESLERGRHGTEHLEKVLGTSVRMPDGRRAHNPKHPDADIDALPDPARHLIEKYKGEYFYIAAQPMASIFTSRGCSFDCNFCAIWEFYDRKTRYLSAKVIVDRMEACEEPFVFFLDDNFLTRKARLEQLCDEIERRGVRKWWMTQGRTDFVAKNPELIRRLGACGMMGLLSGYESNNEDALKEIRKKNNLDNNRNAAKILRDNGIISTGIFMVRPEFEEKDFDELFAYIESLGVAIPLVTILTPLPGTELYRRREDELLTTDYRLFDLLHPLLPTTLSRPRFYRKYVEWKRVNARCRKQWFTPRTILRRWRFYIRALPSFPRALARLWSYQRIMFNAENYLRDEAGIIGEAPRLAPRRQHAV